mmetsp:Transcript_88989/g.276558  ORF Transcript_88989/g.276558 Transcript_88989/m.276558 type:complete len:491 (+) Transcript_88989:450-1922(+)
MSLRQSTIVRTSSCLNSLGCGLRTLQRPSCKTSLRSLSAKQRTRGATLTCCSQRQQQPWKQGLQSQPARAHSRPAVWPRGPPRLHHGARGRRLARGSSRRVPGNRSREMCSPRLPTRLWCRRRILIRPHCRCHQHPGGGPGGSSAVWSAQRSKQSRQTRRSRRMPCPSPLRHGTCSLAPQGSTRRLVSQRLVPRTELQPGVPKAQQRGFRQGRRTGSLPRPRPSSCPCHRRRRDRSGGHRGQHLAAWSAVEPRFRGQQRPPQPQPLCVRPGRHRRVPTALPQASTTQRAVFGTRRPPWARGCSLPRRSCSCPSSRSWSLRRRLRRWSRVLCHPPRLSRALVAAGAVLGQWTRTGHSFRRRLAAAGTSWPWRRGTPVPGASSAPAPRRPPSATVQPETQPRSASRCARRGMGSRQTASLRRALLGKGPAFSRSRRTRVCRGEPLRTRACSPRPCPRRPLASVALSSSGLRRSTRCWCLLGRAASGLPRCGS